MAIKLNNISKKFGDKTAVNISEFIFEEGKIIGLAGNNGAGKSTLFRLILDLLKADSGEVYFVSNNETINPAKDETWKHFVGAYIDEGFLIDFLTPEEFFDFIKKTNAGKDSLDVENIFKHFMNDEVLNQKKLIREFSSGNKQKIGIIGAMINKPQILILDEPFNFLDPTSQYALKQILKDYNKETNATIIISSHNINFIADVCNEVILLEKGEIIRNINVGDEDAIKELETYFNA